MSLTNLLLETLQKDYKFDWNNYEYYVRWSDHIQEDLKRGWSSWNYGEGGFEGTEEELENYLESASDNSPSGISYMDLYPEDVKNVEIIPMNTTFRAEHNTTYIGELYENYWVVIDTINAKNGLSGHLIDEDTKSLSELIQKVAYQGYYDGVGDGQTIDTSRAKVIYSSDEGYHVLEVNR